MSSRAVLRANAVVDAALGLLLLSGTWDGLYDALDLPQARPALLAQLGGALLVAFAYLLWTAPEDALLTRRVAAASTAANALAAAIILVWLLFADPGVGTLGSLLLVLAAVVLAAFALAEARIARA